MPDETGDLATAGEMARVTGENGIMANDLTPIWQSDAADSVKWDAAAAGHLLRRAGFGGSLEEIDLPSSRWGHRRRSASW